jgi:hypothetical protein
MDDDQSLLPPWPEPPQHYTGPLLRSTDPRPWVPSLQYRQLLSKREVLQKQFPPGASELGKEVNQKLQQA